MRDIRYQIELPEELARFYTHVAQNADLPVEQVLSDALYRLAGELSLHALHQRGGQRPPVPS